MCAQMHSCTYTHTAISRSHSWCSQVTLRHYFCFLLSQYSNSHLGRKYCAWSDSLGVRANYFGTGESDSSWNTKKQSSLSAASVTNQLCSQRGQKSKCPGACWLASCKAPLLSPTGVILASRMASAHNCNTTLGTAPATRALQRLSHWTKSKAILKC